MSILETIRSYLPKREQAPSTETKAVPASEQVAKQKFLSQEDTYMHQLVSVARPDNSISYEQHQRDRKTDHELIAQYETEKAGAIQNLREQQRAEIKAFGGQINDFETPYIPGEDSRIERTQISYDSAADQTSDRTYLVEKEDLRNDQTRKEVSKLDISTRIYAGEINPNYENDVLAKTIDFKYVTIGADTPKLKYKVTSYLEDGRVVREAELYEYDEQGQELSNKVVRITEGTPLVVINSSRTDSRVADEDKLQEIRKQLK